MANKKTPSNKTVNILIASITVLIIAILVLVTVTTLKKDDEKENLSVSDVIAQLNIKENPVATLEMENGKKVEIELYPSIAPNTVCNFIELANSGYYDGLIFHRCIKEFMIQGGDPEGTSTGGPGYSIKGEFTQNGFTNNLSHDTGIISMARANDPDSAGSQFFITVSDKYKSSLDGMYASFGKVISGMETVYEIVEKETDEDDKPLEDQVIKSIRVDTKGIEYPKAEKTEE